MKNKEFAIQLEKRTLQFGIRMDYSVINAATQHTGR